MSSAPPPRYRVRLTEQPDAIPFFTRTAAELRAAMEPTDGRSRPTVEHLGDAGDWHRCGEPSDGPAALCACRIPSREPTQGERWRATRYARTVAADRDALPRQDAVPAEERRPYPLDPRGAPPVRLDRVASGRPARDR